MSKTANFLKIVVDFKRLTAREIEISKQGSLRLKTPQTRVGIRRNQITTFYFGHECGRRDIHRVEKIAKQLKTFNFV